MGGMSQAGMPTPGRVRLVDLLATDGVATEQYKHALHTLSQSLARYNLVIVEVQPTDELILKFVLDSVRMFFHQRPAPGPETVHPDDPQDWNRTCGYYFDPHRYREIYDYRPGRSLIEASSGTELPPAGLTDLFAALGRAARSILDALGCSLDLRSFCFADLLDNVPLKGNEVSTSVLTACCHGRPVLLSTGLVPLPDHPHMPVFDYMHEPHAEKGFLTLMKSDKPGLYIRDAGSRWILADGDLGPADMVLYSGLSLYQATAGYVSPTLHRTEVSTSHGHMYGRCSVAFKLMPRATAILHCSSMSQAGHSVGGLFQQPVAVHEFMQRSHPTDQLVSRAQIPSFSFPSQTEEYGESIANLGETQGSAPKLGDLAATIFTAPAVVKSGGKRRKQAIICHNFSEVTGAPLVEDQRFAVRTVYDYLRAKGKAVPTGKPQVVGHKVDLSGLAKACFEAGGRAQFEAEEGFQRFIAGHFQLENASEKEKDRALERLKKLYDQVLNDYVEDLVASSQMD